MIILTAISPLMGEMVMDYRASFAGLGVIQGSSALEAADNYDKWHKKLIAYSSEETVPAGLVPSSTLAAIRTEDGAMVGIIDIRHRLNDHLLSFGGHIGYSVRPEERRKGYATRMLTLGLDHCRGLGIDRVLVTCNKQNMASARTILACGGVLEDERQQADGTITCRYWIEL